MSTIEADPRVEVTDERVFEKPIYAQGIPIRQQADLVDLSGPTLVAIYNQLVDGPEVNKFSDKASAIRRVWNLCSASLEHENGFEMSPDELAKQKGRQELQEARGDDKADEPPPEPKAPPAEKAEKKQGRPRGFSFTFPLGNDGVKPPKAASKRETVLKLLLRKNGATFEEVQEATGWKRVDAYEGIRLIHYANGYGLAMDPKGRIRAYARPEDKPEIKA